MPLKCVEWQETCNMSGTFKNKMCCENSMSHNGTPKLDCGTSMLNRGQQK